MMFNFCLIHQKIFFSRFCIKWQTSGQLGRIVGFFLAFAIGIIVGP
jgi:hypothetical protein